MVGGQKEKGRGLALPLSLPLRQRWHTGGPTREPRARLGRLPPVHVACAGAKHAGARVLYRPSFGLTSLYKYVALPDCGCEVRHPQRVLQVLRLHGRRGQYSGAVRKGGTGETQAVRHVRKQCNNSWT